MTVSGSRWARSPFSRSPHLLYPALTSNCEPTIIGVFWGVAALGNSWGPLHPQYAEHKSAEEHDNVDEQQEQQAFRSDTCDAWCDRHDHEEQGKGDHLIHRSVVQLSGGRAAVHRWCLPGMAGHSA
jgi:hypothetical protein